MPLLSIKIQHPSQFYREQTVTIDFPALTNFYNRQDGTPISRICAVIFGDFVCFLNRFGFPGGDISDAVALHTALELFDEDTIFFSHPTKIMSRATIELSAMISFKWRRIYEEKGKLLGLEKELKLLAPYRVKQY